MMARSEWDRLFGNPVFSPRLEIMHFDYINVNENESFPVVDVVSFDDGEDISPEKNQEENNLAENEHQQNVEAETDIIEQTELVPVDSVIYNIENDENNPKKGFFGRFRRK